ncbi:hypothetical protein NT05LI_2649 [Listeria ivanovii FSL F6-596]|nr:hypothetical protein NT05LI_2649 [Listeria ivanovii FSL F6-596]
MKIATKISKITDDVENAVDNLVDLSIRSTTAGSLERTRKVK